MSRTLTLPEHTSEEIEATDAEIRALTSAAKGALSASPSPVPGRWVIRTSSMVGTLVTPSISVLIRPKVVATNLFHVLEPSVDRLVLDPEVIDYADSGDLMAAFATFYARALERALHRGVPRQYREEEDRLAGVRGRILVGHQVRAGGLPLPIACQFDDHSLDNQLNRVLAGAARRLAQLPRTSPGTRRSLLRALAVFDGVGPATRADLDRPTWFDRTTDHLRATERLARLALQSASLEHEAGGSAAATFLIDMNAVYERFVEDRLRRALRGHLSVLGQYRTTLDVEKRVRMRPDLLFRAGGHPLYVADAKYKLTASGLGRESDYYQLLAYCTALGLPEGLLVYCHHDGDAPASTVTVRGDAGVRLRVAAVRLDGSPTQIDQRLEALARAIRDAARSHAPNRAYDRPLVLEHLAGFRSV